MIDLFNKQTKQFYRELPTNGFKRNICWYPSAGKDFRSVEMWMKNKHPNRLEPMFYFFTDKAYEIDVYNKSINFINQNLLSKIKNFQSIDFFSQNFEIGLKQIFNFSDSLQEKIITQNKQLIIDHLEGSKALLPKENIDNYEVFRLLLYNYKDSIDDLQLSLGLDYANIKLEFIEFYESLSHKIKRISANITLFPLDNKDFFVLAKDKNVSINCLYIKRTGGDILEYINNISTDINTEEVYCRDVDLEWLIPKLDNFNQNKNLIHCLSDEFKDDKMVFLKNSNHVFIR